MKVSPQIEQLINAQINMELYSANVYLTMAAWFFNRDLDGFGNFFIVQMQEEQFHAMKYFRYLHDVEGTFRLETIAAPDQQYSSIRQVFEQALHNEEEVTRSTHSLIDAALQIKDFATYQFLEWFVREQVEEESTMRALLAKLSLIGDDKSGLFLLDRELSQRSFNPNEAAD